MNIYDMLKKSVVLAVALTAAVLVGAAYQLATQGYVDTPVLDVLLAVVTYWIGVLTPQPKITNGE